MDREERGTGMKGKKQNKNIPLYPYCYKDSKPCPTVNQYQLDAPVTYDTRYLHHTRPPRQYRSAVRMYRSAVVMCC